MPYAEAHYQTSKLGGNYADMGKAMGGCGERLEDPARIAEAFKRARRGTEEEGRPILLGFVTARETSAPRPERRKTVL